VNKKALSLAVYMAISYPGASYALGLGEIESASHLNQPFKAKISLLSTNGGDLSNLKVKVASPSVFNRVGIDRPDYLNGLRFRSTMENGKPVILVNSSQPIQEPFINFLLEVSWPKGQLLKEYTVLLDPPVLMQPGTSIASNTAGVRPEPARTTSQPQLAPTPQQPQPANTQQPRQRVIAQQPQGSQNNSNDLRRPSAPLAQQAVAPRVSNASNKGRTYRVRKGDTLYKVAKKVGYQGIREEQMMIALFDANPTAFRKRNINNLKSGVVMRRPSLNEAQRISLSQARQEIRNQTSNWKAQRKAAASATAKKTSGIKAPVKKQATQDTPTTDTASAKPSNNNQARIEVLGSTSQNQSANNGNLAGQAKLDDLNRQLTLASESLTARTHENNELKSRISELESLLRKKNRLITLKNEQLAELQASLSNPATALAAAGQTTQIVDPITEQGESIEKTIMGQEGNEGTIVRTQEPADAIVNNTQAPEIFEPPVDEPTIDSALKTPTQPEENNEILDLLSSPLVMGLGAGSLLALIGGLLFVRRRNAKDEYDEYSPIDFDDPSLAPGSKGFESDERQAATNDISADPFADTTKKQAPADFHIDPMEELAKAETAPLSPATPVAPVGSNITAPVDADAEEDDILQEADVYIVYGLHEQAEVELKKAIEKQPANLEYRAKLLENYHAADNKEAFELAAAEFAQMQGQGKEALWDKVSAWGRKMLPASPLFVSPSVAAVTQAQAVPQANEAASGVGGAAKIAGGVAAAGVAITAGKAIAESLPEEPSEDTLDFAESELPGLTESAAVQKEMSEETETSADVLDFDDMDLDSLLSADDTKKDTEEFNLADLGDALDLGNTSDTEKTVKLADVPEITDVSELSEPVEGDKAAIPTDTAEVALIDDIPLPEPVEETAVAAPQKAEPDLGDMDFDFSEFELGNIEEEATKPALSEAKEEALDQLDMSDFDDLGLDLDLGESAQDLIKDLDDNELDVTNLNLALDGSNEGVGKILPENSVYKMSANVEEEPKEDILGALDDDLSFLDLDTGMGDDLMEGQVSTKLDLARAYMDMGDVDGARTTLEEVMIEGNDGQRKEAEALLQQTG